MQKEDDEESCMREESCMQKEDAAYVGSVCDHVFC